MKNNKFKQNTERKKSHGCTSKPKAEGMMLYLRLHLEQTLWSVSFGAQTPH